MTLYEYNVLDENEKLSQLWKLGTCLNTLKYINRPFALYGIDKFYVELEYAAAANEIVNVRTFKQGEHLQKHLDSANLKF